MPTLGSIRISKLNKSNLQKRKTETAQKESALKTEQNIYGEFRSLLNYAKYLPKNPPTAIRNFKEVYFEVKKTNYNTTRLNNFKNASLWPAKTVYAHRLGILRFFAIAYYTEIRKGEINALK